MLGKPADAARFRAGGSRGDMEKCQKCAQDHRPYCECGAQFHPPKNDAGQEKCGKCRKAAASKRAIDTTEEAKAKRRVRKAAVEAEIASSQRKAEVRQRAAIKDVSKASSGAESAPNAARRQVPEQKIRAAHGVGPRDSGVGMDNVPGSRLRMPS